MFGFRRDPKLETPSSRAVRLSLILVERNEAMRTLAAGCTWPQLISTFAVDAAASPATMEPPCGKAAKLCYDPAERYLVMANAKLESILDAPPEEAVEAAADAAAEAEFDAGQGIPHAEARKWLESRGKPDELPCPLPPT
jgi:hypothetical protein